jgi:hypothetical protein
MKDEVFKNAMRKAQDQIAVLIDEETPQIKRAMSDAAMVASQAGKDAFTFKLRLTVEIEPCGDDMNIGAAIGYGVAHKVKMDKVSVSLQPELIK